MSNRAIGWAKSRQGNAGYKAVLTAMSDTANQYMATWASRKTLAKVTGLKESTIRDHQNRAVKNGDLVLVPWQTPSGADASPGYFLGCVRGVFDELPPLEVAFAKRINFKGPGQGGRPRGHTPAWWSGERKSTSAHRCTACGATCTGGNEPDGDTDPGEGRREGVGEGVPEGYREPFGPPSAQNPLTSGNVSGAPEGDQDAPTLEGPKNTTLEGGEKHPPFKPKGSKPKGSNQPCARASEQRRGPSGLPAGDGLRPSEPDLDGIDENDDPTPVAAVGGIEAQRRRIAAMDPATLEQSLANLAANFPDLHRGALAHATRRGLSYDLDAFNRETLWHALQAHLGQRSTVAA
jgi:hypothetical protein